MKKLLQEFKEFALRGNVMDLAVGVIIGAAFQAIINSLVNDVISPLIGLFANTDLTYLSVMVGDVEIRYGAFLTAVINFIIMAVIIFLMVKGMNALAGLGKKKEPEKPAVKMCPYCRSKVAAEATRCPYCTSMLEVKKEDKKEDKDKKEEADKVKDIVVEQEGIQDRIVRLTPNSSSIASAILSKDGESLYYLSAFERGFDMWKMDLRKRETKLLHKMGSGWADMEMDKEGKNLFVLGSGSMQKMDLGGEKLKPISYRAEMKMDLAAERAYMYDNMCREEQKRFYEVNMHGVDWKAMTANYRRFLPHINNKYDYAEMLSELLGELNVSHTGGRYRPGVKEATASLGLLYDWNYTGKGMKVDEVVEKGPFDRKTTRVKPGVVIEKIDGQPVDADFSALLNGKAGKKILVSCYDVQSKERWDEVVKPISGGTLSSLLYERWVKQRAADVDKWSNGRLGYVHIESMDDGSFRTVYSDILGKYNNREGIVIDTRFNGGGRLHEDIEVLFSGQKYLTQVIRGREACDMPSRRWNKPSIMVQCEANYSNAHGTPWVYKHRQMGKLVGAPVPGTMTSVNWVQMQDPDLIYGIPVIGYRLPDGSYLENKELEPDVYVLNAPETVVKGEDTQLKAAVDELLKELDAKK